ncbi:hypothetical protein MVEN_00845900 [Mycena venus]|uniref:Protein ROT1 n=1 Tax=Mycena venus TaxID=2733690 RepID=A0A8H6YFE8_9AGAR|nr:hypothetical protein MVEN_00845900 [Mycena venus]
MLSSLFAVALAVFSVSAQDLYGPDHNTTSIVGTWSSGTKQVVPGAGFADPTQETFTYPKNSGVGYSFSDDGWYELARFRYSANGSHPECIIATVSSPPIDDGYQQVQSPCAKAQSNSDSNFIQEYNITELYASWRIFTDVTFGPKLHLYQFDGSPVAPLFRLSDQPNMLPKQKLRNTEVEVVTTTSAGFVTTETILSKRNDKPARREGVQRRGWFW